MRLLPPPWEGTHPAFPKVPEPLPANRPLHSSVAGGCLTGALIGLARVAFRKGFPGVVLDAIGASTIIFGGTFTLYEIVRAERASDEIYPILVQDKIPIPRRKLFEPTVEFTQDDYSLLGAVVGLTMAFATARISRRLPSRSGAPLHFGWRRAFGGAGVGFAVGDLPFAFTNSYQIEQARAQRAEDVEKAQKIYTHKMGKPPTRTVYSDKSTSEKRRTQTSAASSGHYPIPFHTAPLPSPAHHDESIQSVAIIPQPLGSRPHTCIKLNGKEHFLANRDYFWKPANTAEAIETLQDHIQELNETRTGLARQAEFLWYEIADREHKYSTTMEQDIDSEPLRKQRKALELLSSMHGNLWGDISVVDWLIADSKKQILQFKSNGTWIPEKKPSVDISTYTPDEVLEKVREHKQKTEAIMFQLANVIAPTSEDQSELEKNQREMRENDMATADLIEEFERRRSSGGSSNGAR